MRRIGQINRLLAGFDGALTTAKWAAMTKSSQDTALRDIQQLIERGVLVRSGRRPEHDLLAQRAIAASAARAA